MKKMLIGLCIAVLSCSSFAQEPISDRIWYMTGVFTGCVRILTVIASESPNPSLLNTKEARQVLYDTCLEKVIFKDVAYTNLPEVEKAQLLTGIMAIRAGWEKNRR